MPEPTRSELLDCEIDLRLLGLYDAIEGGVLDDLDERQRVALFATVRAAYGQGYMDALREDADGRRAELPRSLGFEAA